MVHFEFLGKQQVKVAFVVLASRVPGHNVTVDPWWGMVTWTTAASVSAPIHVEGVDILPAISSGNHHRRHWLPRAHCNTEAGASLSKGPGQVMTGLG